MFLRGKLIKKKSLMKSNGFASLLALVWFIVILSLIFSSLVLMKNYSLALWYLKDVEKELAIEKVVVSRTYRMFREYTDQDACDFIEEYEACWYFKGDDARIDIEFEDYTK
jgi:hypothetical protein